MSGDHPGELRRIWVVTDGKAGNETPALSLAEALAEARAVAVAGRLVPAPRYAPHSAREVRAMGRAAEKVTGGCHCGRVRYEAEAFLAEAYYCHCRMCQKSSGAPAQIAVFVAPDSLRFTKEPPHYYASSPFGRRGFCPACGSQLVWEAPKRPDWTNLTVGSLDAPEAAQPAAHICVETRLSWFVTDDDLPETRSDEDPDLAAVWAEAEGKT